MRISTTVTTLLGMKFAQPIEKFIQTRMVFVCKLNMKALYLDKDQNGYETVIKNIFEISYVTALKLHALLASFYFIKKQPLPSKSYCNFVITKILRKMENTYQNLDLEPSARIEWSLMEKVVKYAFHRVLKGKYSSFYQDQNSLMIRPMNELQILLDSVVKERQTFRIKSHAFQRF